MSVSGYRSKNGLWDLSVNEQRVVLYVLENERVTPAETTDIISMSIGTARSVLRNLSETNPPVLNRVGNSKTDPQAYFVINSDLFSSDKPVPEVVVEENDSGTPSLFSGLK